MAKAPVLPAPAAPVRPGLRGARRRPIGLAGIRGFMAAAHHLSFTAAAEELKLTQSAISRQVGSLERELGQKLFLRKTRALALTAAGTQLFRAAREGIGAVDRSVEQIRGLAAAPRVTLTTFPSFASLWLVPRLAGFQRLHPAIEIRIDASESIVADLERERIDLALRRCRLESAPRGSIALDEEHVTPVLSAELQRRFAQDGSLVPEDLLRMPLIDIDSRMPNDPDSWETWFALAGADSSKSKQSGMLFVGYDDQSIQAAARGQGVALAQSPLYGDLVCSGQLVAPFPSIRLVTGYSTVLVENPGTRSRPEVALLRDWLLDQFRQT
jgi:LysR family glycine cleavage system transcriptional activator